jgi:hypothetical protein
MSGDQEERSALAKRKGHVRLAMYADPTLSRAALGAMHESG